VDEKKKQETIFGGEKRNSHISEKKGGKVDFSIQKKGGGPVYAPAVEKNSKTMRGGEETSKAELLRGRSAFINFREKAK